MLAPFSIEGASSKTGAIQRVVAAVHTSGKGKALLTRLDVVPNWQKTTIACWALKALAPDTHVLSDGLATFAAVKEVGFTYEPIVVNGTGKTAGGHPRFLAVNTTLGNLKTWMASTFKGFKLSHYTRPLHGRVPVPLQPAL